MSAISVKEPAVQGREPGNPEPRSSHDHGGGRPRGDGRFDVTVLLAKTGFTHHQLCRAVHANGKVVANAINNGASPEQADRWSVRCGWHPASVWGEQWWDGGTA